MDNFVLIPYCVTPIYSHTAPIHKFVNKVCRFSVCYHSRDEYDNTPLHTSARCGNLQAVKIFLEWQCRDQEEERLELPVRNAEGKTPAHVAAECNHPK